MTLIHYTIITYYEKAMKNKRAVEHKDKGNDYFKQANYEKALQCYGKAVELVPDYRDAWNNIHLTLVKQGRTDEAVKCKEILAKLSHDPKPRPKSVGLKHFSLVQKVFIVVISVLLVIAVVVATEALMGVGGKQSGPGPVENTMNSLVALSPVGLNSTGNNTSGISIPGSADMVSGSFETVQNSLVAISQIGIGTGVENSSGTSTPLPS